MRKVLSFVLVLALVLGSFSMVFGAGYSDMAGEDSSEAVDVLSSLGVVSGYPDGTFKPDRIVTRAEMAKLIVAALGLEKFATATTSKYPDMTAAPWAQGFVAYGTSLGFISGYPDGTFKPNNTVTYEEACSMIIRALGYTSEFLPGEWPAEWVIKAKSLGILDGVTFGSSAGANRGDIAEMIYNALELYIGYINNDGDWVAFGADEEKWDTMLVRLGATTSQGGIIWGDEDTLISLRSYVGAEVDRYLNKDDEIIKVVPVSTFLTGSYDGDGTFEADNDVDYNFDLDDWWVPFFFNGEYTYWDYLDGSYTDDTVKIAVEITGKTITDIYSVSIWEVSDDFFYDEDYADQLADDQELGENAFILDFNDDIDFLSFEWYGAEDLEDIDEDDVVYVYASDGAIRKLEVGKEVVTGDVTKISSDGEKITVNGKVYTFAYDEMYLPNNQGEEVEDFVLGDNVTLSLDYHGYIYGLENNEEAEGGSYAVLLETEDGNPDGTLSDPATDGLVKLFLADGSDKIFEVDEDLAVTDVLAEDGDWLGDYDGISMAGIIVEYGLDDDGVIDFFKVVADGPDVTFDVTAKGYYAGTPIDSAAVLFTFDGLVDADAADKADEDNYDVIKLADLLDSDDVNSIYYEKSNKIKTMLIFDIDNVVAADEVYGVVVDWYESSASDTDYVVEMLVDGALVAYDADEDLYDDVNTGVDFDMYFYALDLNAAGELVDLVLIPDMAYDAVLLGEDDIDDYANGAVYDADENKIASIDSDAVIYYYDSPFEVKSLTRTNLEGYYAVLFDLDEDNVADVILTFDSI